MGALEATQTVNILLVDDEPNNLIALEAVLSAPEHRLVPAHSGEDALRWLLREEFAVVLLDVRMPGMDGFETASLIRSHPRSRATPIIFLTAANKDHAHIARGYSLGAVDYILKPFDPDILRSKVAVFVELYRKEQQVRLLAHEQAARAEAEAANRRFAFLAAASHELARLFDDPSALQRIAQLTADALAGVCLIDVAGQDGALQRIAASPVGSEGGSTPDPAAGTELTRFCPRVLGIEAPVLLSAMSPDDVPSLLEGAAGIRSAILVPIPGREGAQGVISLLRSEIEQPYAPPDLDLVTDLGHRVGLALDNAQLYQDAQSALQARDAFFSSAYHDLKTPLAVIKGHAQILQRRAARLGDDGQRIVAGLETIDGAAGRLVRMIDEMLDVARLQAGQPLTLNRRPTDLVAVVESMATLFSQSGPDRQIVTALDEPALVGSWDATRLERVLGNLLSNAKEYSPAGSEILVRVSREEDAGGAWAVLSVQDHGIGIPADELDHIFERYFRGRKVAGSTDGTGVGLAGVKQIVDEHGGTICVTSQEDVGTTVLVRLPLEAEPVLAQ